LGRFDLGIKLGRFTQRLVGTPDAREHRRGRRRRLGLLGRERLRLWEVGGGLVLWHRGRITRLRG
jgi:hypothetical protein